MTLESDFYVLQVIKSFNLFDMHYERKYGMLITSLIMVRFEIRVHCWNCLSLLYTLLLVYTHDIRVNFYVLQVIKSFDLFDMIWIIQHRMYYTVMHVVSVERCI